MTGPGERKTGCICLGYQDFAFVQGAPKRQNILTEKNTIREHAIFQQTGNHIVRSCNKNFGNTYL